MNTCIASPDQNGQLDLLNLPVPNYGNKNDDSEREIIRPVSENPARSRDRECQNPSVEAQWELVKNQAESQTQSESGTRSGGQIGQDNKTIPLQSVSTTDREPTPARPPRGLQQETRCDLAVPELPQQICPCLVLANKAESNHTPRDHSPSVNDSIGGEARESTTGKAEVGDAFKRSQTARGGQSFDGATYIPEYDHARLGAQLQRVFNVARNGDWLTLDEICAQTGDHAQAVSARLRDFRKAKFGGHTVDRRRRGNPALGIFEYRLVLHT